MPYITEEIFQALPHDGDALMIQSYPEFTESLNFPEDEANFEIIMNAIRAVRSRRAEMNVPPSKKPRLIIVSPKADVFEKGTVYLSKLAYAGQVEIVTEVPADTEGMVNVVTDEARMFMPLSELVDLDKERERINREIGKAEADLAKIEGKLNNEKFISKAPENVVAQEREKAAKARTLIENLKNSLEALG